MKICGDCKWYKSVDVANPWGPPVGSRICRVPLPQWIPNLGLKEGYETWRRYVSPDEYAEHCEMFEEIGKQPPLNI